MHMESVARSTYENHPKFEIEMQVKKIVIWFETQQEYIYAWIGHH
jgi:hypothetical protein